MAEAYCEDERCYAYAVVGTRCFRHFMTKLQFGVSFSSVNARLRISSAEKEAKLSCLWLGWSRILPRLLLNQAMECINHFSCKLFPFSVETITEWLTVMDHITVNMPRENAWSFIHSLFQLRLGQTSANSQNWSPYDVSNLFKEECFRKKDVIQQQKILLLYGTLLGKHRSLSRLRALCHFIGECSRKTKLPFTLMRRPPEDIRWILDAYARFPSTSKHMNMWRVRCLLPLGKIDEPLGAEGIDKFVSLFHKYRDVELPQNQRDWFLYRDWHKALFLLNRSVFLEILFRYAEKFSRAKKLIK